MSIELVAVNKTVRLARAWSKGALFAVTNPDAGVEAACETVPEACTDQEFVDNYWPFDVTILQGAPDALPGATVDVGWELTAEILAATGVTDSPVDIDMLINDPLVGEIEGEWQSYDADAVRAAAEAA